MARCSGIRADGGRCGAQAIRSSEYCVNHHPDYEEARRRRNSKGGKRGGRGRPQVELANIKQRLSDLADSASQTWLTTCSRRRWIRVLRRWRGSS